MNRRMLIFGVLGSLYTEVCRAEEWPLVTKDEFERDIAGAAQIGATQPLIQPGAPTITVEEPDAEKLIKSPVTIRLSFRPTNGAVIDVKTLRVTYGFLGIDITSRIVEHATLSASGLFADNAQLPAGHHRVTIRIADNVGHVGVRTFEFTVV
jgi:hypothetical protein